MVQQGSLKRRGSVEGHTLRPDFMRISKEGSIIIYEGLKGVGSKLERGGGGGGGLVSFYRITTPSRFQFFHGSTLVDRGFNND